MRKRLINQESVKMSTIKSVSSRKLKKLLQIKEGKAVPETAAWMKNPSMRVS